MTIMIKANNIAAVIVNYLFHRQFHKNLNIDAGLKELRQKKDGLSGAEQRANNLSSQLTQTQNSLTVSRADVATLRQRRDEAVAEKGRCEEKLCKKEQQLAAEIKYSNFILEKADESGIR